MTGAQIITRTMEQFPENELIFASKLYANQLCKAVSEETYYQTLGRMCKAGSLCRIAKGTYYRPKISKYGIVPPSQKEIIAAFTDPDKGAVVGYSLYNSLKLTTQVGKTVEVLSSRMEQQTKTISNVFLRFCDLVYTPEVKRTLHVLEVLQNFSEIQDLNYRQFLSFCEQFAHEYDASALERVIQKVRYQKRTLSFLRSVLNYYGVQNDLSKYLSTLSAYKHPSMEEIYEAAYAS